MMTKFTRVAVLSLAVTAFAMPAFAADKKMDKKMDKMATGATTTTTKKMEKHDSMKKSATKKEEAK